MRTNFIIISVMHLIMSILFVCIGVVCFVIFGNNESSLKAMAFIVENTELLHWMGAFLTLFGLAWLALFAFLNRKSSYDVLIKKGRLWTIDIQLIKSYIEKFYEKSFGDPLILKDVFFDPKGNLRIATEMNHLDESQEKKRLERFSTELAPMLREILGFHKEIVITIFKS